MLAECLCGAHHVNLLQRQPSSVVLHAFTLRPCHCRMRSERTHGSVALMTTGQLETMTTMRRHRMVRAVRFHALFSKAAPHICASRLMIRCVVRAVGVGGASVRWCDCFQTLLSLVLQPPRARTRICMQTRRLGWRTVMWRAAPMRSSRRCWSTLQGWSAARRAPAAARRCERSAGARKTRIWTIGGSALLTCVMQIDP